MKNQLKKWMTYQKERFPLLKYSLLVAAFSASGLSLSYLLTGATHPFTPDMFMVAFAVTLLIFLQLRIADEHKDFDFDKRYHPERPVPRGLITLMELRTLAIVAGALQILISALLSPMLLIPLAAAWSYMGLMTREFFAGNWLRSHPVIYMLTHMCILLFTDLFITSCHFLVSEVIPPPTLLYFLGTSFCLGTVIELGRKIKAPGDETNGRDTYSQLWGRSVAVKIWIASICASFLLALTTAAQINAVMTALMVLLVMLFFCGIAGVAFLAKSTPATAKKIDTLSGLWTLATYLVVGLIPLILFKLNVL